MSWISWDALKMPEPMKKRGIVAQAWMQPQSGNKKSGSSLQTIQKAVLAWLPVLCASPLKCGLRTPDFGPGKYGLPAHEQLRAMRL